MLRIPERPPHPDCYAIRPLPARGERLSDLVPAARFFVRRCGFSDLGSSTFSIDRGALASSFRSRERENGSGTPVDADPYPPHPAVRLCLPLRKQLACRRSTRGSRPRDFRAKGSASRDSSWDDSGAIITLRSVYVARKLLSFARR